MSATILKQEYQQTARSGGIVTEALMETPPTQNGRWLTDIITETSSANSHLNVTVVDKGTELEFTLPNGTAQFADMAILDSNGTTVWKTQSFNKKTIVWPKQTTYGRTVPAGRYMFRMKQGNRQASGIATV